MILHNPMYHIREFNSSYLHAANSIHVQARTLACTIISLSIPAVLKGKRNLAKRNGQLHHCR